MDSLISAQATKLHWPKSLWWADQEIGTDYRLCRGRIRPGEHVHRHNLELRSWGAIINSAPRPGGWNNARLILLSQILVDSSYGIESVRIRLSGNLSPLTINTLQKLNVLISRTLATGRNQSP